MRGCSQSIRASSRNWIYFARRALVPAGRMADSNTEHRRILEAIAARDAEAASCLMEAHVLGAKQRVLGDTQLSD
jgi:DNA-binding GntR family transcriptional regulator